MKEWMHGEHPMLGKHHTDEAISKIKSKRATQNITPNMLKGLEHGRSKVWTPEMRAKMSEHAKERKLGHGRGEEAGNWRGGITPLVRTYRVTPKYKAWRTSVLNRDNHTCLKCGARELLEVNHIITVKEIFKQNKFATTDELYRCSLLWDMNNGETLCKSCHRLVSDKIDNSRS